MSSLPDPPGGVNANATPTYLALCGVDVLASGERLEDVLANARSRMEGESDVVLLRDDGPRVTFLAVVKSWGEVYWSAAESPLPAEPAHVLMEAEVF